MRRNDKMSQIIKLKTKELTSYISFLKRISAIGDDFLVKGDMWIPSIKSESNTPGTHIGKDPMLNRIYKSDQNFEYTKFTCSRLKDTLTSLSEDMPKGRDRDIFLEVNNTELIIHVNDVQWVVASKYIEDTLDMFPNYNMFDELITSYNWTSFEPSILEQINNYCPASLRTYVDGTDEMTTVRLAKNLFKLSGVRKKKLDYTGEFSVVNTPLFDNTVANLVIHMVYPNIECIHSYYIRKY